jgi:hypothetical protein
MSKEQISNTVETSHLNIENVRSRFQNIIIDLPERFIGQYNKHRFSIIAVKKTQENAYDITVEAPNGCYVVETWEYLNNIDEAIMLGVSMACL